jgi:hypothetical protein
MMTLDVLSSVVPPEMVFVVASKDTAKSAWETIKVMRVGDDRVRAAVTLHLLHQFEMAKIKEEESIKDYSMRLSGTVQHLAMLRETIVEPKVVGNFFATFLTSTHRSWWRYRHYSMWRPSCSLT